MFAGTAALCGPRVLDIFGVSLDAFSVAGGGVLCWIGFTMLHGNPSDTKDSKPDGADGQMSLTPLILFAASPGTVTGVITLAVNHTKLKFPLTALVAVALATVVMWLAIWTAILLQNRPHGSGYVRDTVTRFMGLIVIAMGVQFALTGIRAFSPPVHNRRIEYENGYPARSIVPFIAPFMLVRNVGWDLKLTPLDSLQPEPHSINVTSQNSLPMAALAVLVGIIAGFGAAHDVQSRLRGGNLYGGWTTMTIRCRSDSPGTSTI